MVHCLEFHSYLNFGDEFFFCERDGRRIVSEKIPELVNIVDQTLAKRHEQKVSVQKFWLNLPSFHHINLSQVHDWIKTLVASNIKKLILNVDGIVNNFNSLPEEFFAAKKLNVLDIQGFKLELPLEQGIKFPYLHKVSLSDTHFDEHFVQALCASCSALEDLRLASCQGLGSLQIAGNLHKLKTVLLRCLAELTMVDIVAPNLENLYIESCIESCRWMLQVVKITCGKTLKYLCLVNLFVNDGWLKDLLCNQPNLEEFHLRGCLKLQKVKISSDRLKYLSLSRCLDLIDIELHTPNLSSFTYECSGKLPTFKLMKASVLLEVVLEFCVGGDKFDSHWYCMLMKFLGNFKQSKSINLQCLFPRGIVIPKDMRKNSDPPLFGTIATLHIEYGFLVNCSLGDIVDSFLWISPQLNTLTFVRDSDLSCTLKFIYEDASAEDEKTFRRHKLKEVEMENFTCMEQQELRNYLFSNEDQIGEEASIV